MLRLAPQPKFITFDCYGTLVQWHQALREAVRALLQGADEGRVTDTVEALRTVSMEQQQRPPYRTYKTILQTSLAQVMADNGMALQPGEGETFLSHLQAIPHHPDVPAALRRLRSRFRLAIISNTDDDLIAGTIEAIGVPIDCVITAQQARAYKPDHRLFRHAHAVMGVAPQETVHVGIGQVTDLKVCHEMGIRSVWIDRLGETLNPDWAPHAVLPDLPVWMTCWLDPAM